MVDKPLFKMCAEGGEIGIPRIQPDTKEIGLFLCVGPAAPPGKETFSNQNVEINFTGKPGTASSLYYSLMFQLPKWSLFVVKPDEWVEVSPTHKEYYDRTHAAKQQLEATIKTGLTSAASSVADYELLAHDLRKYQEILNYFNKKDEHSLKSMFIDQVDVHTGEGISMRSIAPRWPTLIYDFQKLTDEDVELDKISKKLNVSKAESVLLSTKNRLYKEWKEMFRRAAMERYERLKGLAEARKKSVEEYREWLKPYISRFKMTRIGTERAEIRAKHLKSFFDVTGVATFSNGITIWAWKDLKPLEPRRAPAEFKDSKFVIDPYDGYVRKNIILDTKKGLAALYPWLANPVKFCSKDKKYYPAELQLCPKDKTVLLELTVADQIVEEEIKPMWRKGQMGLDPSVLYYVFFEFTIDRVGQRLPHGEIEDITFLIRTHLLSQNVMLVKILELICRERELERYIDEILGIKKENVEITELVKRDFPELYGMKKEEIKPLGKFVIDWRKMTEKYRKYFRSVKRPDIPGFLFFKKGEYESDFNDRITKQYLSATGALLRGVKTFLKEHMGVS